jgi:succinyl-CoA synthetase beta subunit
MNILKKYGVTVPKGEVATTPEQAYQVAKTLGKSQGRWPIVLRSWRNVISSPNLFE